MYSQQCETCKGWAACSIPKESLEAIVNIVRLSIELTLEDSENVLEKIILNPLTKKDGIKGSKSQEPHQSGLC